MKQTFLTLKLILTFIAFSFLTSVNGQKEAQISYEINSKGNKLIHFHLGDVNKQEVQTPKGKTHIFNASGGSRLLKKGYPDLQHFGQSLIIPPNAEINVKVKDSEYKEIEDIKIAPSKGDMKRNQDPENVPYTYERIYKEDTFFPESVTGVSEPYIFRKHHGQVIYINPLQYNAVKKTLRVYEKLTLQVEFVGGGEAKEKVPGIVQSDYNSEFEAIYKNHFLNYEKNEKYTPVAERGKMLVISHPDFTDAMQDFITWKRQSGIPVEMVSMTNFEDSTDIKNYVADYYNNNGLTYLLLVGDAEQVPPYYKSGDSDAAYGHISGDDSYAEVIVGRLSGEDVSEIETQVERIIQYEKEPSASATWYKSAMGIASQEGGGSGSDDGEVDYEHIRNILTDLDDYTYSNTSEFFEGDQGGEDATGDPSASDIGDELNSGVGMIAYTGHGSNTAWGTSGFSVDDINNLTNDNMLPFIFDVACVNGNFNGMTCFAEKWMRATNGDKPTGAIAIIASTINQSWAPPMAAQDEMVDILVESYEDNIKRTFGGITINGCMLMNDEYTGGSDMTDTWTIFGDPSLMVRTDTPESIEATHKDVLLVGQSSLKVNVSGEKYVTLTRNGELLSKATSSNGEAQLSFESLTSVETLTLTVTGYNKTPYISNIEVVSSDKPYVVLDSVSYDIVSGDDDVMLDYSEEATLFTRLKNVSQSDDAYQVFDSLSTIDPYITLIDSLESFGRINMEETSASNTAFRIKVRNSVPDQHIAKFTMNLSGKDSLDNSYEWSSEFSFVINAPELTLGEMKVVDTSGNYNGILDPGENGLVKVVVENTGHDSIGNVFGKMAVTTGTSYLDVKADSAGLFTLPVGDKDTLVFPVSASSDAPTEYTESIKFDVYGGAERQYNTSSSNETIIGEIPVYKISSEGTITTSTGYFYDSGGPNENYENDEQYTMTFKPYASGNMLKVMFDNFDVEKKEGGGCYDYLKVYDGVSTDAPLIDSYCNENPPSEIIAGNDKGALTFEFYSDGYEIRKGWKAEISSVNKDTLIFTVTDGTDSLAGASVKVDNQTKTTDDNGQAKFFKEPGNYSYTITMPGYDTAKGTVDLLGTIKEPVALTEATYDITFNVFDEDGETSLEADVTIDGKNASTTDGSCKFTGLSYQEAAPFKVEAKKDGYKIYEDSVDIDKTKEVDITLEKIRYPFAIKVIDQSEEILEGAEVSMGKEKRTTGSKGIAEFELPAGTYRCLVDKEGYTSEKETVNLTDTSKHEVKLLKLYETKFVVKDSLDESAITNAIISVDSLKESTGSDGAVTVKLAHGEHQYTITAEGYNEVSSTLTAESTTTVNVVMMPVSTGLTDMKGSTIQIYPNPASERLQIDNLTEQTRTLKLQITDISGKLMKESMLENRQNLIDVSSFSKGIYIIRLSTENQSFEQKIFIQ